jgi:hypothetical protein
MKKIQFYVEGVGVKLNRTVRARNKIVFWAKRFRFVSRTKRGIEPETVSIRFEFEQRGFVFGFRSRSLNDVWLFLGKNCFYLYM